MFSPERPEYAAPPQLSIHMSHGDVRLSLHLSLHLLIMIHTMFNFILNLAIEKASSHVGGTCVTQMVSFVFTVHMRLHKKSTWLLQTHSTYNRNVCVHRSQDAQIV